MPGPGPLPIVESRPAPLKSSLPPRYKKIAQTVAAVGIGIAIAVKFIMELF